MGKRGHFEELKRRVDVLEDSVQVYHAKTDERIKTLFKSCDTLAAACERLGSASLRLMWSLIALLGLVVTVSLFTLVYGAVGDHGFNAVTHAAQEVRQ